MQVDLQKIFKIFGPTFGNGLDRRNAAETLEWCRGDAGQKGNGQSRNFAGIA